MFPSFVFVLTLELGIVQLHADNGRKTLARVVAVKVAVLLFQDSVRARVVIDRARQGVLETVEVGTALVGVNIVGERQDAVRGVAARPLHGNFDRAIVAFRLEINRFVEGFFSFVDVIDEVHNAACKLERFAFRLAASVKDRRSSVMPI